MDFREFTQIIIIIDTFCVCVCNHTSIRWNQLIKFFTSTKTFIKIEIFAHIAHKFPHVMCMHKLATFVVLSMKYKNEAKFTQTPFSFDRNTPYCLFLMLIITKVEWLMLSSATSHMLCAFLAHQKCVFLVVCSVYFNLSVANCSVFLLFDFCRQFYCFGVKKKLKLQSKISEISPKSFRQRI